MALTRCAHPAFDVKRRLKCSLIGRFVNGTVDPAQQGAYARSIAAIAQQLGLPLWFVEVRHASTHEDLPSLQILRSAARNVSFDKEMLGEIAPLTPLRPRL